MKIGIFGGCFNPPHKMHKRIALQLIESHLVDKVIYVPTGNKYQKNSLASDTNRYNMLKIMCDNNPNLSVSDYEFSSDLTYTYQTLDHFKKKYPEDEIYFICGADNLEQFKQWRNYQYILDNYQLIVINRNNIDINQLEEKFSHKIIEINIMGQNISSTEIRDRIKQHSSLNEYLDYKVIEYIKENHMYE